MMTANAIKKLEKAGAKVTLTKLFLYGDFSGWYVEGLVRQREGESTSEINTWRVIKNGDHDDSQRDHFAGTFVDNVTQAIGLAQRLAIR